METIDSGIRAAACDLLARKLKMIEGPKDLVLNSEVMKQLDLYAGLSTLRNSGVEKVFKFEPGGSSPGPCEKCVYIIKSSYTDVKLVADHINADKLQDKRRQYWILFVPRKLHLCEVTLEQEGVYGYVSLLEFHPGFVPLDQDLLSLELPEFFPSFFLDGDLTWIHTVTSSLIHLQKLCGRIPNIYGQGRCAKMVYDSLRMMMEDSPLSKEDVTDTPVIDTLILLDRDCDYVSLLLSQMNYEGILDETFGIQCGKVAFDEAVTKQEGTTKYPVINDDMVFRDIRHLHFSSVFSILKEKAHALNASYAKRPGMTISEMKNFVETKLKGMQQCSKSLALHIGACEVIVQRKTKVEFENVLRTEQDLLEGTDVRECFNYIEETIIRQMSAFLSLRLLCLMSITQDGVPPKDYRSLITCFLQSYGYEHMVTFFNLKKLGLFVEQLTGPVPLPVSVSTSATGLTANTIANKVSAAVAMLPRRSPFRYISKKLNLLPKSGEGYDFKNPKDAGYVYSGVYIPLTCRLVEQVLHREGFQGLEDTIKVLPGHTISQVSTKGGHQSAPREMIGSLQKPKVVLVYFLGGVTFAEISAFRFLGRTKGYHFIIATTNTINGNTLLQDIMPKPR